MEVYKEGIYWYVRNAHGPVPKELQGEWTSKDFVDKALEIYQSGIRNKAVNVSKRLRERKERASSNRTVST